MKKRGDTLPKGMRTATTTQSMEEGKACRPDGCDSDGNDNDDNDDDNDDSLSSSCGKLKSSLAQSETRAVNCLRMSVISVLLLIGATVSAGVYSYTRAQERQNFRQRFRYDAYQLIESFHRLVEQNIGSSARMSSAITSYAKNENLTFPFVTLPDFEMHGSHLRVQSGSHIVRWTPLVTDDTREAWEEYALKNRFQIERAFENDVFFRSKQDSEFGLQPEHNRQLQEENDDETPTTEVQLNMTVLDDGTNYHPKIWKNSVQEAPGDEPEGGGPYLPGWQRR